MTDVANAWCMVILENEIRSGGKIEDSITTMFCH